MCDYSIVPDSKDDIQKALRSTKADLILLSGGTGFTPDDVTPEAVLEVIDKRADSVVQYLQSEALKITPMTCLSRTVIGMITTASDK